MPAVPAQAQGAAYCAPGQGPRFQFGFAALKAELGDTMGQPTECEHANTANGDTLQQTTTGLAFYRKSTNTPTFTDGFRHWALTPAGLVSWEGSAVDPPRPAVPGSTAPTGPASARPKPPTSFIYSVVEAPGSDTDFWCLTANPSCNRDDWWAEYNAIQGSDPVQYRFLGPALVTEQRFVEAIWLLWQWPEGASLLREAAASGVRVPLDSHSFSR